jgi:hypothetical protein
LAEENEDLIVDDDPTQPLDDRTSDADDTEQDSPPEEPAARAAFYQARYEKEAQRTSALSQDKKRLEGTVEEERTAKRYWHEEAKRKQAAPTDDGQRAPKQDQEEEETLDLAELATADDGGKRLDAYIERKATKIAKAIAKGEIEGTLTEVSQSYRVTSRFKDLENPESEFAIAVFGEEENLKKDPMYEGMKPAALRELAAQRVENQLLRSGKRTTTTEDARDLKIRRSSQPTSTGKPTNVRNGKVEVDPRLASRARARGLDEKDIADAYDPKSIIGWQPGQ